MAICGQHGTTRTLGQSAQTIGPKVIVQWHKLAIRRPNPKTKAVSDTQLALLIVYCRASPSVKESPKCSVMRKRHKIVRESPISSEGGSRAKTSRILRALQVVSGFNRVPRDSTLGDMCPTDERENYSHHTSKGHTTYPRDMDGDHRIWWL